MLVSVIIPAFNAKNSLRMCLDSVCSQKYKNIEIICIDDCSEDETPKIIKEYTKSDRRVKMITHNNNLGVSATRNEGILIARGDYLMFVDADDYIENDTVNNIVECLEKNDFPDALRYNFVSKNKTYDNDLHGLEVGVVYPRERMHEIREATFVRKNKIPTYSVLMVVKKNIVKQIRFDNELTYLEDAAFYRDVLLLAKNFVLMDLRAYHYLDNENSATRSDRNTIKKVNSMLHLFEKISSWTEFNSIEKKIAISRYYNLMAAHLMRLSLVDQKSYKKAISIIHSNPSYKKWLKYSRLKGVNMIKKGFLWTIAFCGWACMTKPYLFVAKFRYGRR